MKTNRVFYSESCTKHIIKNHVFPISADTKAMFAPSIPSNGNPYMLQQNKQHPRPELQILQHIKQKTKDLKLASFKRCFRVKNDADRKICMKEIVEKTKRQGMEDSNSIVNEYDENQDQIKPERFETKKFSQDYLDVNDLLRNNKKMDDKKNKKRIIFKIVPNENKFSRFDYDLTSLRRFKPKNDKEIVRINHDSSNENNNKRIIFKIVPDENKLVKFDKTDNKNKNILRTLPDDYYDSDSSSSEEHTEQNNGEIHHQGQANVNSDSDESSSYEEVQIKKKNKAKVEPAVYYMQGPSRMYGEDSRRRLPHFLPKRYYWDEDDMRELNNFWFQGPQGKYPGHYKTPH